MAVLRRLGMPVSMFLAVMALLAAAGLHRPLDYAAYRALYLDRPDDIVLSDEIRLIDLPYPASLRERGDPGPFRARIADLLSAIAADPANLPRVVVLDVWFSKDDRGLATLSSAIARLDQLKVRTYASFNPDAEGKTDLDALMREHAQSLYDERLAGYGHTRLQTFHGILSYPRELAFPSAAGTRYLRALPTTVARDLQWPDALAAGSLVIPVGAERSVNDRTVAFVHSGDETSGGRFRSHTTDGAPKDAVPDLRGAVVVVGSLAEDVHAQAAQAGPKLVAWALDDARKGHRNARVPLDHAAVVAGLILAMALLTATAVALLFKYVTRLQTRPAWLAAAGILVAIAGLIAVSAACLVLGYVVPAGLPLLAIVTTGLLAWRYALKFLASGAAEGAGTYDVFISYSRKHGDWVASHLFAPLAAARGPDGRALRIFFDRAEIGIGEAFTSKYMWAIVDSRVFIPVFSADYYMKNHCRNEMDLAYKRYVDKRIRIAPVAIETYAVPEIFSVLNYIDVSANPHFIEDIRRTVFGEPPGVHQ